MKKYQLMAPGPTPVPSEVLLAMAQPMIHHRTPQYEAVFVEVRAGLKRLFQTSAEVVPLACSGTGAMEAAVVNTLSAGDRVVDAVSSLGIADLPMDVWGVDLVVSGSQKGLMLPPGVGFCALNEKAWKKAKTSTLPKYYFNLTEELKSVVKNEAHFTPAVSIVVGLREALRLLEAEGLANVFKRHDRLARATRAGAEALGLELFAKATPSPALTALMAPKAVDREQLVAAYPQSHNITIAGGQGEMKGKLFRLGHMGYAAEFDTIAALSALEQVLAELGVPVDFGASVAAAQKIFVEK